MTQINAHNVHHLKPVWSFSTGVLNGHEGGPLVVDGIMYVHTPYLTNIFAIDLNSPDRILWQYKPKQNSTVSLMPLKSPIPSTGLKRSI
jgi:methanol dehydrogenase (cytochrome c) subunit 1